MSRRIVTDDLGTGYVGVARISDEVVRLPDIDLTKSRRRVEQCSIIDGEPLSCRATSTISSTATIIRRALSGVPIAPVR